MNNSKFLKIVIVFLLVVNIGTLTFMWVHRPPKNEVVEGFFAKELQFTNQQKEQFEELVHQHREAMCALKEDDRMAHDAYLDLLKNPKVTPQMIHAAVSKIGACREKEELAMFYHFQKVRAICSSEQKKKFDEIIREAARMMRPKPNHDGPPPGRENGAEMMPPPPRP
ncbi:Spy/CpxP family protein refolding chaperone [Flavobacterium aciduliphilum]|uniref:Heavy-metal resistance protein n=1 Tax=Flavobacterium aciduliphilum TaxID=1101402 RepID=A0A328YJQ4_9FLAO|nr:Spy/CpxP family protein refolding chaperone [Flavobacterium aciduliphilum]RAR70827.1 heavy-metal resistance protein [Flavobacterium aciduliphilum]